MAGDLNPDFSFDIVDDAGDALQAAQAPWEFSGALKQAREDGQHGGTSIDHKIKQRVESRKQQRAQHKPAKRKRAAESEEESSDNEDEALPGELDDDTSDGELTAVAADDDDDDGFGGAGLDDESSEEEDGLLGSGLESEIDSDGGGDDQAVSDLEAEEAELGPADDGSDDEGEDEHLHGERITATRSETDGGSSDGFEGAGSDDADQDAGSDGDDEDTQRKQRQQSGQEAGPSGKAGSFFDAAPKDTSFSARSFDSLRLSRPLLKAVAALGYTTPTPIQAACVPLGLLGRDICGSAMTGSGKTAAFALPFLERLLFRDKRISATYVLVLTPTRELAVQVHSMTEKLAQFTDIRVALAVGGLSLQVQAQTLRTSPEVLVATPGRVIDHLRNTQSFGLDELQVLVLDEADRLLEMGFAEEVAEILRLTPRKRQTMLFSATMSGEVRRLAALSLRHPVRLAADVVGHAPAKLQQEVVRLKGEGKEAVAMALCSSAFRGGRTIVFFRTKQAAHRAKILFGLAGLPPAAELHGNMTQAARLQALDAFRKGEAAFLLATDVAARGLDILGVEAVLNYDAPASLEAYVHRVGRTARAGAGGRSVTLAEDADRQLLKRVLKETGATLRSRTVPPPSVAKWERRIADLEPDIQRILKEEGEEAALRKAEMEVDKAANMMEHEAEILARPPRTWFQTEREKKATARAARQGDGADSEEEDGPKKKAGKGDKRKGAKEQGAKEDKKGKAKGKKGEEDGKGKKKNALVEETVEVAGRVRAAKALQSKFREEGMAPSRAGKAALAALAPASHKKAAKQQGANKKAKLSGEGGEGGGLFEGDGTGKQGKTGGGLAPRVYAGGSKTGKPRGAKPQLSKRELNRVKRGGKGRKAFKSKAKHKRR